MIIMILITKNTYNMLKSIWNNIEWKNLLYVYVVVQIFPWFNAFLNWFQFYLPLFHIMVMTTQQKKIKIKPVWKILHQN